MSEKPIPYRILFMNSGKAYSDPIRSLCYLLPSLDRERLSPRVVFYFRAAGSGPERIGALGVPVFFLNRIGPPEGNPTLRSMPKRATRGVLSGLKVGNLIRRDKLDLMILEDDALIHMAGVLGAKLTGIPVILYRAGKIGEGRVGIDPDLFVPGARNPRLKADLGIPLSSKVVVSVSPLEEGEGHRELLNAIAWAARDHSELALLLVGDGPIRGKLRDRAIRLGVSDRVFFTGWRSDLSTVLAVSDLFVQCPTRCREEFGLVTLEAMAMGRPVIVSDDGPFDAVIDSVTGYRIARGDVEGMATAMVRLLSDDELARRFGENARKRIDNDFNLKKTIRKLEKSMVESVIPEPRSFPLPHLVLNKLKIQPHPR